MIIIILIMITIKMWPPEHVLPPIHHLLHLAALPEQLQGDQAGLVVEVLEARLRIIIIIILW